MNHLFGRSVLVAALVSLGGAVCGRAQTLDWTGANATSSIAWGSGNATTGNTTNWSSNGSMASINGTGTFTINIATGNFSPSSADTMAVGGNWTLTSMNFDNAAGLFPTLFRLNANPTTGTTTRTLTFVRDASNTIMNVVNNANVFISGNSSSLPGSFSGLNLTLNYNGMGIINVGDTSSLTIGGNAATFRGNGVTTAGIQKTGTGTLTIGGVTPSYTGGFQLSGGTLFVGSSSNLTNSAQPGPFGSGTLTIDGGTKLASTINSTSGVFRIFDNPVVFTGGTVTLGDAVNNGGISFSTGLNSGGTSALLADTTLNIAGASVTLNRSLSGSGSLTKAGAGTLNINQPMSYTGGTILQAGQLQLGADNLPTNGAVTFDGGTLRVGNSGFTAAGHATNITSNGAFFSIGGSLAVTWSGDISGVGSLSTIAGSTGTLTLSGTNTYSGGTVINAGTIRGSVGTGSLNILSGATYDLLSADRSIGALTGGGNVTLGSRTLTSSSSSNSQFTGIISGSGGFTKDGSGTLTLAGTSSYTGATTVSAGTLAGVIGAGDLSVARGGTYDLGGADRSISNLNGDGSVALGANSLTTNIGTSSSFSGAISGTGGLVASGAGKLVLSGVNTYTGSTLINAGELVMNGRLSSPVTIASGATLSGNGTFSGSAFISGVHSPGNSPGIQTFQSLTYNSGASVLWELNSSTTTQGSPTAAFDQIIATGGLTFAGPTTLNLRLNGSGSTVSWNDALWASNQTWIIFNAAGGVTGFSNLSLNTTNLLDSLGQDFAVARVGSSFGLELYNSTVLLKYYTPVPEPSTWQALLIGLAAAGIYWHRRRSV